MTHCVCEDCDCDKPGLPREVRDLIDVETRRERVLRELAQVEAERERLTALVAGVGR